MILAGIDEAGYGPTLGPLVVSASVFRIPDGNPPEKGGKDLWAILECVITRKPDGSRIPVNDSKKLFQQRRGLRNLEEGVLPFLCLKEGSVPRDLRGLLESVARRGGGLRGEEKSPDAYLDEYPWYRGKNLDLPVDTFSGFVLSRSKALRAELDRAGVEFLGLASWPVEVLEFNQTLEERQNKSLVSFAAVASFLRRLWTQFPRESVEVVVDRQGGRMRYGPVLFESIRPRGIRVEVETEDLSVYHLTRRGARRGARGAGDSSGTGGAPAGGGEEGGGADAAGGGAIDFRVVFAVDSETLSLPVALSSMLSKYLREAHMILFNRFFKEFQEGLRPTAGYAVDARRFLDETGPLRRRLGIADALLVRRR